MNDAEIARTYVRYFTAGADDDAWAPEKLAEIAIHEPARGWRILLRINALPIPDENCRTFVRSVLGGGVLEELIGRNEATMLPVILRTAENNPALREELGALYPTAISPEAWVQIQDLIARPFAPVAGYR